MPGYRDVGGSFGPGVRGQVPRNPSPRLHFRAVPPGARPAPPPRAPPDVTPSSHMATTVAPTSSAELDYRPSYRAAGVAALAVFILYLVTLSPSTAMWDTSEYIAAAY